MNKLEAYDKTIRVIQSCQDDTTLSVAEQYKAQYVKMYVQQPAEVFHLTYIMNLKRKEIGHEQ